MDRFDGPIATHWDELTADEQRLIVQTIVREIVVLPPEKAGGLGPERVSIRWRWDALAEYTQRQ